MLALFAVLGIVLICKLRPQWVAAASVQLYERMRAVGVAVTAGFAAGYLTCSRVSAAPHAAVVEVRRSSVV